MISNKIKFLIGFFLIASFCGYQYIKSNFKKTPLYVNQITEQVMAYPITEITKRCQKDFGYSDADMTILEQELKRFLILAIVDDSHFGMYSKDVDNLWHTFILFTKDYARFCTKFAGKFIHHVPTIDSEKTPDYHIEVHKDFTNFTKTYEQIFNEKLHDIWFLDDCEKK